MITPQERVEAYIRDWNRSWENCGGDKTSTPAVSATDVMTLFAKWKYEVESLVSSHWAKGAQDQSGSSFGSPPAHDPVSEKVQNVTIKGESAIVETVTNTHSFPEFYEYRLKMEDGSWLIDSVLKFYDDENVQAFTDDEIDSLLGRTSRTATLPHPKKGDEPNCDILFKEGHIIKGTLMQQPEPIRVRKVGNLSVRSGALIVRDFGYSPQDARPLSLCVPPGEYKVERDASLK